MLFFYLIILFCGSNSLPVEKMNPKMRISKSNGSLGADFTADPKNATSIFHGRDFLTEIKTDPKNATSIFHGRDFLTEIKTDPKKFIAEVQNLDPDSIAQIISLLQALRDTSTTRETELIDDMNNKKDALDTANQALIDAEDALDRANQNLANAKTTAQTQIANAETAQTQAAEIAAAAKVDDTSKTSSHATAKEIHDQEIPTLDDEQRVLTDVIDMMSGLHKKYAGVYTVGTCQPKNSYTENECCAPGYNTVATSAECREAWETMAAAGDPGISSSYGGAGDWGTRPAGCFIHQSNLNVLFNRYTKDQITSTLAGDDKVICKSAEKYTIGTCQPSGTYETNMCCQTGYTEITSLADCEEAQEALGVGSKGGAHNWDHRPTGCFQHVPDTNVYFNNFNIDQIVRLIGDDKVVCKLVGRD